MFLCAPLQDNSHINVPFIFSSQQQCSTLTTKSVTITEQQQSPLVNDRQRHSRFAPLSTFIWFVLVRLYSGGGVLSVQSETQTCIWPSWCHCHSLSLASVKSRLVLPFWYWLTWVVPEKGPLNGCVCAVRLYRKWILAHTTGFAPRPRRG